MRTGCRLWRFEDAPLENPDDVTANFNLTGSRQDLQEMGQVRGISKVPRSRNNAKGTCQV
jgi:hypothetical protein